MDRCAISIVMAVYNGEKFLRETLDSIVSQTFRSFEVIVIDDASTDSTGEILESYAAADERFRVFRNEENLRLARSLNRGMSLAHGKYIVRMDADDICLPNRLAAQFAFMEQNPDIGVSYPKFFTLRENRLTPCAVGRACDRDSVKAMFLFFCPVLHPGVIARTDVISKYEYDPLHTCSEDFDMWLRMLCDGVKIACSGDYLMLYRIHGGQITSTTTEKQKKEIVMSEREFCKAMLGKVPDEFDDYYADGIYFRNCYDPDRLCRFYKSLVSENRRTRQFKKSAIVSAMEEVLTEYRRTASLGLGRTIGFLRFGGLSLVKEIIKRKKQGRSDIASSLRAASEAGFSRAVSNGKLPIFIYGDENE